MRSYIAIAALAGLESVSAATTYNMVKEYAGSTFFEGWDFYGHFDNLTNGDAIFVDSTVAASSKLAYVDSTTNHAIIKVDNTTTVPFNEKRNTVRISTQDLYDVGSVWIADMYHVPYGCSVWPAWWSHAPDWPNGGEIDTFEGVNMVTNNQMALHTNDGCKQVNPNEGCVVTDPSKQSYGATFAASSGGVFVTEFAESGISVWFFTRDLVPDSIKSNSSSIDTSALGTPVANWPNGGCSMGRFFSAQNLILDITLCGDFAGAANVFSQTCSGKCYNDYVIGSPSNYDNAFFDIASIRVYSETGKNTVVKASNDSRPWAVPQALWALLISVLAWIGMGL
uniref:Putative glycoside hydrolase family 16 protein n=1 Tax=Moniliophthora roreri TaxID=221103 RepID=A0A0W0GAJ0_MONRR